MPYFDSIPTIRYNIGSGPNINPVTVKDIFFRVKIFDSIRQNTLVYYPYYIKDNETPEDIAYKYYNDPTKNWIVLMANNIVDPQFGWPLSYQNFIRYMDAKYGDINNTYETIHHYEKNILREGSNFGSLPQIDTFIIDYNTFKNTPEFSFQEINLQDGTTVAITTTTTPIFIFDYENDINEAKKQINLISNQYINQIQNEFLSLTLPVSN